MFRSWKCKDKCITAIAVEKIIKCLGRYFRSFMIKKTVMFVFKLAVKLTRRISLLLACLLYDVIFNTLSICYYRKVLHSYPAGNKIDYPLL